MKRPLIGLTMDCTDMGSKYALQNDYITALEEAGALPLAIPYRLSHDLIPQLVDRLDGILFIGGDDLDPALYGQTWHPNAVKVDPVRQSFELALLAEAEKRRLPTLGICLGSQLMNVHRGGSLHQFLPELPRENPIEHRRLDLSSRRHPVQVDPDTHLGRAIGKTQITANTSHKQAVDRLGRGLRLAATAPDGIIEAFEDPTFPLFIGVQWHPERLHDEPEHLALFKLLVDTAKANTYF